MNKQNFFFSSISIYLFILIAFSVFNYQTISEWAMVELLINYQGGFVRRGLLGELNYISKNQFDSFYPIIPIVILSICYLLNFLFIIYLSLKLKRNNLIFFLIIALSPATLLFSVYDPGALFRKDVIFITIVLAHSIIVNLFFQKKLMIELYKRTLFFFIIPILSINILIHEVQFFFIIPHIFLTLCIYNNFIENKKIFVIYLIPLLFFILIYLNKGDSNIINGIKNSLSYYPSHIINKPYNPIHYLEGNLFLMIGNAIKLFFWYNYQNTIQLIITFFLSFYFFWYLIKDYHKKNSYLLDSEHAYLKKNFFKKLTLTFFLIFIISLPVAIDFGRFFHLITMHLIAIFLAFPNKFFENEYKFSSKINKSLTKIFVFCYIVLWVLPHGYVGYAGTNIYKSGFMITNKKMLSQAGLYLENKNIIKIPKFIIVIFEKNN